MGKSQKQLKTVPSSRDLSLLMLDSNPRLNFYSNRFLLALFVSVCIHSFILWGLHFSPPKFNPDNLENSPLQVVLVNSKSDTKPFKADALAQANLDGGGNTDEDRMAKTPLPVLDRKSQENVVVQKEQRVKQLEEQAQSLMTQIKSKDTVEAATGKTKEAQVAPPSPDAAMMVAQSLEAIRLEAKIARDMEAYQKRPKRRFIGARTQEYRFARYVEDWRIKVERVGNLNYPEAAKAQKLYGSLRLTVNIRSDGSVESIEINSPSGHKILDEAAKQIVRLAAPFAPFPEDIRKDTDILGITRTWTFTSADHLVSE